MPNFCFYFYFFFFLPKLIYPLSHHSRSTPSCCVPYYLFACYWLHNCIKVRTKMVWMKNLNIFRTGTCFNNIKPKTHEWRNGCITVKCIQKWDHNGWTLNKSSNILTWSARVALVPTPCTYMLTWKFLFYYTNFSVKQFSLVYVSQVHATNILREQFVSTAEHVVVHIKNISWISMT